jgi:hypothetical protein
MRREQCCHVTYLSLAEPIDNRQVEALLVCRLSPRNNVLRWFYLFPSRYLDKKKESKTRARHLTCRLRLKCDGTRAETRFRFSAKRRSPFKSAGASVQLTTGSRGVRISGSNAGYTKFRGSVKSTGYPLHSPVSTSLPHPCVTVCHYVSTGLYQHFTRKAQKADDAACQSHRKSNCMKNWVRKHRNLASSFSGSSAAPTCLLQMFNVITQSNH